MDFSMGSAAGGSGDEQDKQQNTPGGKCSYNLLTPNQKARLEAYFKGCPHPYENQVRQLAEELGLETKQVTFWFQNKRTQAKHENLSNLLQKYMEKQIFQLDQPQPQPQASYDPSQQISGLEQDFSSSVAIFDDDVVPNNPTSGVADDVDDNKSLMSEVAAIAMEELVTLLNVHEPLWMRSLHDGKFVLDLENYDYMFPRADHLNSPNPRVEASKDARIVNSDGMQLVNMFLDSDRWANTFPTIVTRAQTVKVLESGLEGNRSGALQLMYAEMHVLSPLIASREFYFLRYCKQIEVGLWVITDVSFDSLKEEIVPLSRCWRLPSGCLIHETPTGSCMVTWVEHVEVNENIQTHRLYRDLVCNNTAYGAERWLLTLERMCERFASCSIENIPTRDIGGVINSVEGRRNVMELCNRMVKNFCEILNMSGKPDFSHLSEVDNSRGVRVSLRKNTQRGEPRGIIVSAFSSFWLPLPPHNVFDFFIDKTRRVQWDVLSHGNPVTEIGHISTGTNPGNCVSIIRPFNPRENNLLILQETCIDPLGSCVVYAPVDAPLLNTVMMGEDSSVAAILSSGFVISGDGRAHIGEAFGCENVVAGSRGSLLTVAFQILACTASSTELLNMESLAAVNSLMNSTVRNINAALDCADLN